MKIFLAIAAIMALVLANFAIGVSFEETGGTAFVTVNEFVDITLTDAGAPGFNFGSLDPGKSNNKELDQIDGVSSISPAATVTRETTSNVNVLVRLKGNDFSTVSGPIVIIPVSNAKYDDDGAHTEVTETTLPVTTMTTGYPLAAYTTLTPASPSVKVWFWLSIPTGQPAGAYTSTFSFKGSST